MEAVELVRADCLKLAVEIMSHVQGELLDLSGKIEGRIISAFKLEEHVEEYDDLRLLISLIHMGKGEKIPINLKDTTSKDTGKPKSIYHILSVLSGKLSEVERILGRQEVRANIEHMLIKQSRNCPKVSESSSFKSVTSTAARMTGWLENLSHIRHVLEGFQVTASPGPAHKTYMEDIVRAIGDFWVHTLKREYSIDIENRTPRTETAAFIYCTFCLACPNYSGDETVAIERKAEDLRAVFRTHQTSPNTSIERLDA